MYRFTCSLSCDNDRFRPRCSLLEWSGSDDFRKAKREFWKVSTGSGPPEMAGYLKHAKNLTYAVVLQAGHLAPQDQPVHMQDLITRFVYKQWS